MRIKVHAKNIILLVLSVTLIIGAALAASCASQEANAPAQPAPAQIIKHISPQDASTLIQENQNNPDFVILDVRTPEEVAEGYIANAINIDFYDDTFRDDVNQLDKSQTYLVYCRSGGRSASATQIMAELNFKDVYNLLGGMIDWKAAGLPVTK